MIFLNDFRSSIGERRVTAQRTDYWSQSKAEGYAKRKYHVPDQRLSVSHSNFETHLRPLTVTKLHWLRAII